MRDAIEQPTFETRPDKCPACKAEPETSPRPMTDSYAVFGCGAHAYRRPDGRWAFQAWPNCQNAFALMVAGRGQVLAVLRELVSERPSSHWEWGYQSAVLAVADKLGLLAEVPTMDPARAVLSTAPVIVGG